MNRESGLKNFIVFEGCEGSGKSTQSRLLAERLKKEGRSVWLTHEPGGTPYGEKIREVLLLENPAEKIQPLTEFLLFEASRSQHVYAIWERLAKGEIVICDRFSFSTFAYQGYGRNLFSENKKLLEDLDCQVRQTMFPGLIILFDQDVSVGLTRKEKQKAGNRFEQETIDFHNRVREGFLKMVRADDQNWRHIDANQHLETIEKEVWLITKKHLGI